MREKNPRKERRNQKQSAENLVQGRVTSDHGLILSGPVRSGGDEQGFEAIEGLQHQHVLLTTGYLQYFSTGSLACSARPCRNYRPKRYNLENEPKQEIRNLYQKK